MKYIRAIFRDKFLLFAAFLILLPTGFKLLCGVEGRIFVAQPLVSDPHFEHTVLYMVSHDIDGATALVLNRQYPLVKKRKIPVFLTDKNIPVFWGGPIHDETDIFVLELQDGKKPKIVLFDKSSLELIDLLDKIAVSPDRYRVFMGSAKWGPIQYEMERISEVWFLVDKNPDVFFDVFSDVNSASRDIWLKLLRNSEFYKRRAIKGLVRA